MSLTLRSSSNLFNENERLRRKRLTTSTLNRFLSFNENKSSAVENRRRLLQSTPNLIELLEEDEDDIDDNQASCHECNTCSKIFASEYGLNYHINMHHPNQSILCSICNITFRSHRSLKTHQQRRHSSNQIKIHLKQTTIPNYTHISSYLVLAFSSKQFPKMSEYACEQKHLPLGDFSSKLYQCHLCFISFPCSRTLKYHLLNKHEQYEYKICETILSNIIDEIEFNFRTVNDNDIDLFKYNLSKQASNFGLIKKDLNKKLQIIKTEQHHLIYPYCQHESRTCANLCLQYLSSYSKLIKNYSYKIPIISKGSAFTQGSIVSKPSMNNLYSLNSPLINDLNGTNELTNGRQKRKSIKQIDDLSPQVKKKNGTMIINSKTTRTSSNNKTNDVKTEQIMKTNESKSISVEQSSYNQNISTATQRKILPKDNYMRSSSISSNSSTSTRSSLIKSSSSSTNLTSQRTSKRSLSPSITRPSESSSQKRRRTPRRQKSKITSSSSTTVIKIDDEDDIEQENDDEEEEEEDNEEDNNNNEADIVPIKFEQPKSKRRSKQRQASSGSIEYVQTLNNEQQLNNIENLKSNSKIDDEEIIICHSPPSSKKVLPSSNKSPSKTSVNGTKKSNGQQSPINDEHVRVRCKICGEILEGRSRFSKHVITMHSHLLKKNLPDSKLQQQTAIVR